MAGLGGMGSGSGTGTEEVWTAPTLLNSWDNYDTATYAGAGYRKSAAGQVYLRGLLKTGALGTVMFTLPAGYRPAKDLHLVIAIFNGAVGDIQVKANGDVYAYGTNATWTSLSNLSFDTRA